MTICHIREEDADEDAGREEDVGDHLIRRDVIIKQFIVVINSSEPS